MHAPLTIVHCTTLEMCRAAVLATRLRVVHHECACGPWILVVHGVTRGDGAAKLQAQSSSQRSSPPYHKRHNFYREKRKETCIRYDDNVSLRVKAKKEREKRARARERGKGIVRSPEEEARARRRGSRVHTPHPHCRICSFGI